ncbi:galactosylceramide sulfotransferase-like [Apostichopus japonicus]|uniref:galactosylceramide sulfotransferase-like n=1 Tax=Stichopus japonicus TaxID=307972 RepID=UPI003AB3C1B5
MALKLSHVAKFIQASYFVLLVIVFMSLYYALCWKTWPEQSVIAYKERQTNVSVISDHGNTERRIESSPLALQECSPIQSLVFAKTHKTASSTVGSIFGRFGYERNLSFALPKPGQIIMGTSKFRPTMLLSPKSTDGQGFHILFNHVPFSKWDISKVMRPESKFITILRNPVTHFYSAAMYFNVLKFLKFKEGNVSSNLEKLLPRLQECEYYVCKCVYNGQYFDLGGSFGNRFRRFSSNYTNDFVKLVDRQFDLVLIQEHLDESLLLLKKIMCWTFEDILYMSKKQKRPHSEVGLTDKQREVILNWNYLDSALHSHFNVTLWKRIDSYGPTFQEDLEYFKKLRKSVSDGCYQFHLSPKKEVIKQRKTLCENLMRDVKPYTKMLIEMEMNKTNQGL